MPERYVLVGEKISNSPTPRMMNAAFEVLGLDAAYETFEVGTVDLGADIGKLRSSGVSGFNVTMPYKTSIVRFLDSLDGASERIGAVNTVKREGSDYKGYNTDIDGVLGPLRSRGLSNIKRAYVLGTGGASRAACMALEELGCEELTVLSRDVKKAAGFLSSMRVALPEIRLEVASAESPPDGRPELIFNASPMGSNGIPLPAQVCQLLGGRATVFDAVYFPVETELIRQAKDRHCAIIFGHEMLLYQGVGALRIWTGRSPPMQVMKEVLLEFLGVKQS